MCVCVCVGVGVNGYKNNQQKITRKDKCRKIIRIENERTEMREKGEQ